MTSEILGDTPDISSYVSIFNTATLTTRGLCPVEAIHKKRQDNTQDMISTKHSLYYEIHGNGPEKLLFIMGLNGSSFGWISQVEHFTTPGKALDHSKYSVLVFDNRGVGFSDAPKGPYTTSAMASDVVVLLDYIGWTEPRGVHVISVSLGGMVALELATIIPQRIASLALVVTTAGGRPWSNLPPYKGLTSLTRLTFIKQPEEKVPYVLGMCFPKKWLDAPAADWGEPDKTNYEVQSERLLRRLKITKPQTLVGSLSQMAAAMTHRVTPDRLAKISSSIPKVLILTGDQDDLVDHRNSLYIKSHMPEAEFILWPETGHAIHNQWLTRFNKLMEKMIDDGRAISQPST